MGSELKDDLADPLDVLGGIEVDPRAEIYGANPRDNEVAEIILLATQRPNVPAMAVKRERVRGDRAAPFIGEGPVFDVLFGVSAFGTDLGLRIMEGLGLVAVT